MVQRPRWWRRPGQRWRGRQGAARRALPWRVSRDSEGPPLPGTGSGKLTSDGWSKADADLLPGPGRDPNQSNAAPACERKLSESKLLLLVSLLRRFYPVSSGTLAAPESSGFGKKLVTAHLPLRPLLSIGRCWAAHGLQARYLWEPTGSRRSRCRQYRAGLGTAFGKQARA